MTTLDTAAERLGAYLANQGERFPEDVIDYVMVRSKSGSRAYDRLDLTMPDLRNVLAENQRLTTENKRLTDAVEQLHSLILGSLPNDGSEIPQPDHPWWRAQLDGIVDAAAEIYAAAMRGA